MGGAPRTFLEKKKLASMLGMAVPVASVSPLKVLTLLSAEPNLCLIATSES